MPGGVLAPSLEEQNRDSLSALQLFHTEFNTDNEDAALALMTDDIVFRIVYHNDADDPNFQGQTGVRELLESSKADHFQIEAKNYQVAGDKVTFDYSGIGDLLRELDAGAE